MTTALKIEELEKIGVGKKFQDTLCVMLESYYLFKDFSHQEIEQLIHNIKHPKVSLMTFRTLPPLSQLKTLKLHGRERKATGQRVRYIN